MAICAEICVERPAVLGPCFAVTTTVCDILRSQAHKSFIARHAEMKEKSIKISVE